MQWITRSDLTSKQLTLMEIWLTAATVVMTSPLLSGNLLRYKRSGSLAKFTWAPSGFIHFARDLLRSFKKWILFFSMFIEVWSQSRVQCEWTPVHSMYATHCGHTSLNFGKKNKFITYIYIIFLAYLGENFTLQAALRAGGLYLDSLRAATSSQR